MLVDEEIPVASLNELLCAYCTSSNVIKINISQSLPFEYFAAVSSLGLKL